MRGLNKVHWIRDANVGPTKVITHCGKEGWREAIDNEWTDGSNIFEAVKSLRTVTCKRCLKSYERISNGPWGCKRSSAIVPQ